MCNYTQVEFRCCYVRYTVQPCVKTTRIPINAAPPQVLWQSSLGSLNQFAVPITLNKERRLDERCGDCHAPAIHPSWMTR
jgi:hypothetical protein